MATNYVATDSSYWRFSPSYNYGVPVINLKPSISILKGDGTVTNSYQFGQLVTR